MSEFNYKDYLKNNPLLTEEKISKENSDKLINYFSSLEDEELNHTLRDLRSWDHNLLTKERHDNPMADRMFTDFSSVARWILSIDDGLAKDILYAIQNDLSLPVKGVRSYVNEDDEPMSDEELEDLETRADDHFSEPIKETLDDDVWIKVDALKNNIRGEELINVIIKAMSTDDAHLYLDAIMRDYDIDLEDATEDYYNKNMKGTNPENDPFNINEELEIEEEDHSMFNASILTLSNGETLEVDVIELMDNLVDNLDEPAMKLWNEFKDKMENR